MLSSNLYNSQCQCLVSFFNVGSSMFRGNLTRHMPLSPCLPSSHLMESIAWACNSDPSGSSIAF